MQKGPRTKRLSFYQLKKEVAEKVGGRKKLLELFPKAIDRKSLYDAILFERGIKGGEQNEHIKKIYDNFVSDLAA